MFPVVTHEEESVGGLFLSAYEYLLFFSLMELRFEHVVFSLREKKRLNVNKFKNAENKPFF